MSKYAAIDVGSNSIRLLIAEVRAGQPPRAVHTDREVVRLGAAVFRDGRLAAPATGQALDVLDRMAKAMRVHRVTRARAVGTSALRDAANQAEFVEAASDVLGVPLEVIGGHEEARLVHLGVSAAWPHSDARTVVADLGGGSLQVIVSDSGRLDTCVSVPLGAVRLTEAFLPSDPPSAAELASLRTHVRAVLNEAVVPVVRGGVKRLIATSGTARAVASAVHRVARSRRESVDRLAAGERDVAELLTGLVCRTAAARAQVPGVGRRRAEVIVAGATVLLELMATLTVPVVHYSAAGVRDGVIAELAWLEPSAVGWPFRSAPIAHAC